ncbi:MAG TPA: hypothetical protein DEO60_04885 [Bacteroidales bacterium]|nr:hypothetical protein [Bacteroidales bacterium]HBZ20444.1 hypothetical protein [Bacteroidales bacterium]
MKRIFGILVLSAIIGAAFGQRSIDRLFERYAKNDGFVSLTISGNLLNLIKSDENEWNDNHWPDKITELRILVQEDKEGVNENFFDIVRRDLDSQDYEEFMTVKKTDQDLKMLVRMDGDIIKEFLLIGGGEDNFIIQAKGRITVKEAEDFSHEARKDNGKNMFSELN